MILDNLISKKIKVQYSIYKKNGSNRFIPIKIPRVTTIIDPGRDYSTFRFVTDNSLVADKIFLTKNGEYTGTLILNYKYYTYKEIINSMFDMGMPVSYETIGNIIHMNLREEFLKYKFVIGKILYDKTGHIVINKLDRINNTFRYYEFEIIGGSVVDEGLDSEKNTFTEGDLIYTFDRKETDINKRNASFVQITNTQLQDVKYQLAISDFDQDLLDRFLKKYLSRDIMITINKLKTVVLENNNKFLIDLKSVYWCSKLQDERRRLLCEIKKNEVVCDVFCGVGPLVIPLLRKGCTVYCNDLNPSAIDCLQYNIILNKIDKPKPQKKKKEWKCKYSECPIEDFNDYDRFNMKMKKDSENIYATMKHAPEDKVLSDCCVAKNRQNANKVKIRICNEDEKCDKPCENENVDPGNMYVYNMEAKSFLDKIEGIKIDHYILNLPEHSLDYLRYITRGKIHCYFFCNVDPRTHISEKLGMVLFNRIKDNFDIKFIRKVSPSKDVYKLTYTLV